MLVKIQSIDPSITFDAVIAWIDEHYVFTPTAFNNGHLRNALGTNQGSCKLFAFAKLNHLTDAQCLNCFGQFYVDVLNTPKGQDHLNIRQLMQTGLEQVSFNQSPLKPK